MFTMNITITTTNSITPLYQQSDSLASRIVPNAIVTCMLILTLWITISLIHYGIKTGKWRPLKKHNQVDKLNIGHIYTSIVVCGLVVEFYNVVALVYINTGFTTGNHQTKVLNDYCDSLSDLAYSTYAITIFITAIFLWLRQRIFFQNRLLNVNYNKCVKVLSFFSLFFILSTAIGTLVFQVIPNDHIATMDGCVYEPNEDLKIVYWASMITVAVLYQSLFLGLFVYAIKTAHSWKNNVGVCDEFDRNGHQELRRSASSVGKKQNVEVSNFSASGLFADENGVSANNLPDLRKRETAIAQKIRSILIKTFAVAVAITMLDFLMVVFISFVSKPKQHRRYSVMFASFNAFLRLLLIVLSFSPWKKMLTSLCWV